MQNLVIPASYEVWLTDLKAYLDRTPGSKAALARHIATVRGSKPASAKAQLFALLSGKFMPAADLFLDLAAWLQAQTDDDTRTARIERTDDKPQRQEVRYTTGASRRMSRVTEE